MPAFHPLAISLSFVAVLLAAGCASHPRGKKEPVPPPTAGSAKKQSYWNGDGVNGSPLIVVDLGIQRAFFYKGDKLVGEAVISSGKKGFETPAGSYRVIQKDKEHVSNLYGNFVDEDGDVVKANVDVSKEQAPLGTTFKGAKMRYFLRFNGGYGMHAGRLPGYRASHGCVRLPAAIAQPFFENATVGTPVTVKD